ncbi:MAG TPA: iron ABC transporter permease [Tepidiformaceae bacterium]|jgi:iron complex transport system permease protein
MSEAGRPWATSVGAAISARGRVVIRSRVAAGYALGIPLLLITLVVAASIGPVQIDPRNTASIVLNHLHLAGLSGRVSGAEDVIIWQVRLPRVLTAGLVGATLAASGASYQAVFRNPLADPYLIGVAAGAALGATTAIVSPLPLDFYNFGYLAAFAFVGAMLAVGLTYELARVGRTIPPTAHILAGVAVSAAASAGTTLLMMLNESRVLVVFSWLYGDFTTSSWSKLWSILPYVAAALLVLVMLGRRMNALQLGEDEAKSLGLRVERLKAAIIITASLATAVCVAISGLIGFVGLIVPHVCRMLFGPDHRVLVPMSIIFGATFLIGSDLGARTVIAPQEIPVGILTAAIGAPFFLFLLRRQRQGMNL